MGSPSSIISLGLGVWGVVNEIVTLGYGIGASGVIVPDEDDVRFGVVYDALNLPDPGDVRFGVVYG